MRCREGLILAVAVLLVAQVARACNQNGGPEQVPNVYRVGWDGRNGSGADVGSGIYFYRLIAGDFRATKKIVLIR